MAPLGLVLSSSCSISSPPIISFSLSLEKDKTKKEVVNRGETFGHEIDNNYISDFYNNLKIHKRKAGIKRTGRKICSTLKDLPLQMAANLFSFLPMNDAIFAEKYGNEFLLKAAVKQIETCKIVEATVDVIALESDKNDEQVVVKCKNIANKITSLRVTGIDHFNVIPQTMFRQSQSRNSINLSQIFIIHHYFKKLLAIL